MLSGCTSGIQFSLLTILEHRGSTLSYQTQTDVLMYSAYAAHPQAKQGERKQPVDSLKITALTNKF